MVVYCSAFGCQSKYIKGQGITFHRSGIVIGVGLPLLDISAAPDKDFLIKYDLKEDSAILAEKKHTATCDELIEKYDVTYSAGGSCLNSMRVAQWVHQFPDVFVYFGCIGLDEYGQILEAKAKEAKVSVHFQYHETLSTGTCAVVITDNGKKRSLCADLAASNHLKEEFLNEPNNKLLIEKADYFYITEAITFSKEHDLNTLEIEDIGLKLADYRKLNHCSPRLVIITQGEDQIICSYEGIITKYKANCVPDTDIVDTNGAGDAFVGGFFSAYIQEKPLADCILNATNAATQIIKQSGCSIPEIQFKK